MIIQLFQNSQLPPISSVDIILGIFLAFGLIRGFMKGFIVELASLVALVAGIFGAIYFSYYITGILADFLSWEKSYINIAAFILTFILIVTGILLLARVFTKLTGFIALNLLNRLLGALFGFFKIAFIISVLILFFEAFNTDHTLIKKETIAKSVLYPPIKKFAPEILPSALEKINEHSDWDGEIGF